MTDDAMALLMGETVPAVKFPEVGSKVTGQVVKVEKGQQRDFMSKEPKTWPDGQPMLQVIVTLQTDERDDEDDDGQRKLYVAKPAMRNAIRAAIEESGGKPAVITGGTLSVKRTEDGEAERGMSAPHTYAAKFEPDLTEPF